MYIKIFVVLLLSQTFLLAGEENNSSIHPLIEAFDKDNDGKVFYTEASEELQDDFCQYDVNQDGYIDEVEVEVIK